MVLAGLLYGSAMPQQWGEKSRPVDFYDVKNDVHNILKSLAGNISYTHGEYIVFTSTSQRMY